MASLIAEYYTDELNGWNRSISSYHNEMSEMEDKLSLVIQRNTIPNIAAKLEAEQDKLNTIAAKFAKLLPYMQKQEAALKKDSTWLEDKEINTKTENLQNRLRLAMQQAEKKYVDVKYSCTNFLLNTLKGYKRNDKN